MLGFAYGPDLYRKASEPEQAPAPKPARHTTEERISSPATSPIGTATPIPTTTKLVLRFGSGAETPTEREASNTKWVWWPTLELVEKKSDAGVSAALLFGASQQFTSDDLLHGTVIFLTFDRPVKYDDFRLTATGGFSLPKWEKYESSDRVAAIWIHGIPLNTDLTIEPVTVGPAK